MLPGLVCLLCGATGTHPVSAPPTTLQRCTFEIIFQAMSRPLCYLTQARNKTNLHGKSQPWRGIHHHHHDLAIRPKSCQLIFSCRFAFILIELKVCRWSATSAPPPGFHEVAVAVVKQSFEAAVTCFSKVVSRLMARTFASLHILRLCGGKFLMTARVTGQQASASISPGKFGRIVVK